MAAPPFPRHFSDYSHDQLCGALMAEWRRADMGGNDTLADLLRECIERLNAGAAAMGLMTVEYRPHDKYQALYQQKGKIQAIKEYRLEFSVGLKDAKDVIEQWAARYNW